MQPRSRVRPCVRVDAARCGRAGSRACESWHATARSYHPERVHQARLWPMKCFMDGSGSE
eukprot:3957657-Pleurochrysis_carterae.AAC.1